MSQTMRGPCHNCRSAQGPFTWALDRYTGPDSPQTPVPLCPRCWRICTRGYGPASDTAAACDTITKAAQ